MDRVNLEKRKGCLPSGGNSRVWLRVEENGAAKKFPAGGAWPAPAASLPPGEAALRALLSLGQWVTCPPTCDASGSMSLLLGSGHSQSGQDP